MFTTGDRVPVLLVHINENKDLYHGLASERYSVSILTLATVLVLELAAFMLNSLGYFISRFGACANTLAAILALALNGPHVLKQFCAETSFHIRHFAVCSVTILLLDYFF